MPYRISAGAVVFNPQGQVLIGKRNSGKAGIGGHVWQFPQGGIDRGEKPFDGAVRELYEETSIISVSLIGKSKDWIYYDFPDEALGIALKGKYRGQKQKWFAFLFEGEESEINVLNPANGKHKSEFSDWRWEELSNVANLIVPFKHDAYLEIVAAFSHITKDLQNKNAKVKKLKNKHAVALANMKHKLFPKISLQYLEKQALSLLEDKRQVAYGLFDENILVGFIELGENITQEKNISVKTACLNAIYITPAYRRNKLSKKLLKAGEKWAAKKKLNEIISKASIFDERVIAAHKYLGFEQKNREVNFKKNIS